MKKYVFKAPIYFSLFLFIIFMLFPVYILFLVSLTPPWELVLKGRLFPSVFYYQNFINVWTAVPLAQSMLNSLILGVITVGIAVPASALGGYSISRFLFRGRNTIMVIILAAQMFSLVLVLIPIYATFYSLHLLDNYLSVGLVMAGGLAPFSLWYLSSYFDSIPRDLEEQAMIDGCSRIGALLRVIIPVSGPGLAVVGMMNFISAWSAYLEPSVLFTDLYKQPVVVIIYSLVEAFDIQWHYVMPAMIFSIVPVLVLFFIVQRWMTKGLLAGAIK